jgi:predicted acyl esterase
MSQAEGSSDFRSIAASTQHTCRLAEWSLELRDLLAKRWRAPEVYRDEEIQRKTVAVEMRDGVRLATDLYLPPRNRSPAIAMRTPYGRHLYAETFAHFARCGYAAIAQDCRGTGDSEPDTWDFLIYEREDGLDFVEWVYRQEWFDGFLGGCGGSYVGATQVYMAMHPRMGAIAPEVTGIVYAPRSAAFYNFVNSYSRCVGKGKDKIAISYEDMERRMSTETLAGGYFDEPLTIPIADAILDRYPHLRTMPQYWAKLWLWEHFNTLPPDQRVDLIKLATGEGDVSFATMEPLANVFGRHLSHGGPSLRTPGAIAYIQSVRAPVLLITGWYDWGLGNALATWDILSRAAHPRCRARNRLLIAPSAHNVPGYHEGAENHPELTRNYRTPDIADLLLHWHESVRTDALESWPQVVYYLMGANEWYAAPTWPPPEARPFRFYLSACGALSESPPDAHGGFGQYTYNPQDPTPTVGGSLVSCLYPPGSVDVSEVQKRADVACFTTEPFARPFDVVGPLVLILYAASSAIDTDFVARLSDVFPDGRAIQLQTGIVRARYRDPLSEPTLLEPGRIYQFEIDMWATANQFKRGHRLRLDISSADFPKYHRNANRGGNPGPPIAATQTIYHDQDRPSQLVLFTTSVIPGPNSTTGNA